MGKIQNKAVRLYTVKISQRKSTTNNTLLRRQLRKILKINVSAVILKGNMAIVEGMSFRLATRKGNFYHGDEDVLLLVTGRMCDVCKNPVKIIINSLYDLGEELKENNGKCICVRSFLII